MKKGPQGRLVLLLWLALAIALLAMAAPGARAQSPEALIAGGPAPDLILLYTGDVIGYLGPCG